MQLQFECPKFLLESSNKSEGKQDVKICEGIEVQRDEVCKQDSSKVEGKLSQTFRSTCELSLFTSHGTLRQLSHLTPRSVFSHSSLLLLNKKGDVMPVSGSTHWAKLQYLSHLIEA